MRNDRLSDLQWERIRDHFPEENIAEGRPGRKPVPARQVLEAVLALLLFIPWRGGAERRAG
jgi:transposase